MKQKTVSMFFKEKLDANIQRNNSLLCIGLDSAIGKIPKALHAPLSQFIFNTSIIDATSDLVCAYKPNTAFYEARGAEGIHELKQTCDYLQKKYPEIPIILDAKRADIGITNNGYAEFAFDYLHADAITLHPYLGKEALKPFLDKKDKGCIILCRTSNPGAGELQDLAVNNEPLYKIIAKKVINEWNYNKNCLLVMGATYPSEIRTIRKLSDDIMFLVPGIGTQGGNLKDTIRAGLNSQKTGSIITASRSILFASERKDYPEKARIAAENLRNEINKYRI